MCNNRKKYVNMADINFATAENQPDGDSQALGGDRAGEAPLFDFIELLFFAYRDFVGDPDAILAEFGYGRAHHRVLHFVNRNPGLRVADLLDILKITKQSLGRVLKQLVDDGHIEQREGKEDRRERLLYATARGRALALSLAAPQSERFRRAIAATDGETGEAVKRFLMALVNDGERAAVTALLKGDQGTAGRRNGTR